MVELGAENQRQGPAHSPSSHHPPIIFTQYTPSLEGLLSLDKGFH